MIFLLVSTFFLSFYFVVLFISASNGWRKISQRYPGGGEPDGKDLGWINLYINKGDYKNAVRAILTDRGVYLKVFFMFRPWHPPILIPWEELQIYEDGTAKKLTGLKPQQGLPKLELGSKINADLEAWLNSNSDNLLT